MFNWLKQLVVKFIKTVLSYLSWQTLPTETLTTTLLAYICIQNLLLVGVFL
jgi:hypothetical protein